MLAICLRPCRKSRTHLGASHAQQAIRYLSVAQEVNWPFVVYNFVCAALCPACIRTAAFKWCLGFARDRPQYDNGALGVPWLRAKQAVQTLRKSMPGNSTGSQNHTLEVSTLLRNLLQYHHFPTTRGPSLCACKACCAGHAWLELFLTL